MHRVFNSLQSAYTRGMKTFLQPIFTALIVIIGVSIGVVAQAEQITQFSAEIDMQASGIVSVTETIAYDFGAAEHHGIYRDIPYRYAGSSGTRRSVKIRVQSVQDEAGNSYRYETSRSDGTLRLKIGDPETLVSGEHTYVIRYTADGAINWFDGQPEFYWNVTGNGWLVEMERVQAVIRGPQAFDLADAACFTGTLGSQEMSCSIQQLQSDRIVAAAGPLAVSEGLTVVVRFPAGAIPEPTPAERVLKVIADNWGFALPIVTLAALWVVYLRFGKDPRGRGTIIPEYEAPKSMSPAMLGYLIDEKIDARDISASIIGLAVKGHLTIKKEAVKFGKDTYRLTKRNDAHTKLTKFEEQLLDTLFANGESVTLKALRSSFSKALPKLHKTLSREAERQGYFDISPSFARNICITIGTVMFVAGLVMFGVMFPIGIGLLLSGVFVLFFSSVLARRSLHGVHVTEHIKGFKRFLSVTEAERLKFHNAPKREPNEFMAMLPFAIALAVEKEWAAQFADIAIPQPEWFNGNWTTFNAAVFASSLSSFSDSAKAQAFTPASSGGSGMGGGGFSGGGFGGGGGGSW